MITYLLPLVLVLLLVVLAAAILWITQPPPVATMAPMAEWDFPVYVINLERKPERFEYVSGQLERLHIDNYERWLGTDGWRNSREEFIGVTDQLYNKGKGLAGCASSHIRLWQHIATNKMGWTLILEDDAHFHPQFLQLFKGYWQRVPQTAKIIFPGFCGPDEIERSAEPVLQREVMCLQGYMLNWEGAQYLLDKLVPVTEPIDIAIVKHFSAHPGSFIFNGNAIINGIRANDYKEAQSRRCMFNGIIYQNHEEQGSTIHQENTVY